MISAEVICDSISPAGIRLTTFKLRYPKFIHGEFMTHRVISRNASSSRAVPTAKLIEEVREDSLRVNPIFWGKNQKGMQASEELDNTEKVFVNPYMPYGEKLTALVCAKVTWEYAAQTAADLAQELLEVGTHKQIVNRLLEPFSHINVVATATEWDNFFGLRLHKDAQPEMRALAIAMWEARKASTPKLLKPGEWHLPFVDFDPYEIPIDCSIKVSVARCARVSYESFETGKRSTVEEDLALCARLIWAQPLHASPTEHQAMPDASLDAPFFPYQWGNFVGWRQYRKMLPGEAKAPLPEGYEL